MSGETSAISERQSENGGKCCRHTRWTTCALSGQPLEAPTAADWLGRLYNREVSCSYVCCVACLTFLYTAVFKIRLNPSDALEALIAADRLGRLTHQRGEQQVLLHAGGFAQI